MKAGDYIGENSGSVSAQVYVRDELERWEHFYITGVCPICREMVDVKALVAREMVNDESVVLPDTVVRAHAAIEMPRRFVKAWEAHVDTHGDQFLVVEV